MADQARASYDADFTFRDSVCYVGKKPVTADEYASLSGFVHDSYLALENYPMGSVDVAVRYLIDTENRWYPVFSHYISVETSAAPSVLSIHDYNAFTDTEEDYPVENGLGALVVQQAEGLKIRKSTPATEIDWSHSPIRLRTNDGTLLAEKVVITVSTGVLASMQIKFTPALPDEYQAAISSCPLGHHEKVGMLFSEKFMDFPENVSVIDEGTDAANLQSVSFVSQLFDRPVIVAAVGSTNAKDRADAGTDTLLDFAVGKLTSLLGSSVREKMIKGVATNWSNDPLIRGAYSYTKPGGAEHRSQFNVPIEDRLFFAGKQRP